MATTAMAIMTSMSVKPRRRPTTGDVLRIARSFSARERYPRGAKELCELHHGLRRRSNERYSASDERQVVRSRSGPSSAASELRWTRAALHRLPSLQGGTDLLERRRIFDRREIARIASFGQGLKRTS